MIFNLNSQTSLNITKNTRGAKNTIAVPVSNAAVSLLAANPNRAAYSIYNPGPSTVFVREGAAVSSTLYDFQLPPGFYWKEDFPGSDRYVGVISGITASGTSNIFVSEGSVT